MLLLTYVLLLFSGAILRIIARQGDIDGETREGERAGSERVNCARAQEGRNVTVPDLMCGSNASSAGISGRVSPNRFDAALSATTAIGYFARFCWCTMLVSIVISTSNPASTAFFK